MRRSKGWTIGIGLKLVGMPDFAFETIYLFASIHLSRTVCACDAPLQINLWHSLILWPCNFVRIAFLFLFFFCLSLTLTRRHSRALERGHT